MDNDENGCMDTPAILKHLVPTKTGINHPAIVVYKKGDSNWDMQYGLLRMAGRRGQTAAELQDRTGATTPSWKKCSTPSLPRVMSRLSRSRSGSGRPSWGSKPNKINATLATLLNAARGEIKRLLVVPSAG